MSKAMSAHQAAQTIDEVRTYRQGLTARAVGMIWVIWGLVLAVFAMQDLFVPASQVAGNHLGDHSVYDLHKILPAWIAVDAGLIFAATVATYIVWRSHAIAREEDIKWKQRAQELGRYVAVLVALAAGAFVLDLLLNIGDGEFRSVFGAANGGFSHLVWTILVAATIAFRTRTRVSVKPAVVGIGVMLVVAHLLGIWPGYDYYGPDGGQLIAQSLAISAGFATFSILVTFTSVGLYYFQRG